MYAEKHDYKEDSVPATSFKGLKTLKALKQMRKANVKDRTDVEFEEISGEAVATVDMAPIVMRPYEDICKDAVINFKAQEKYNKLKRGKAVGVKRRIFVPLIEAICEEEEERQRLVTEQRRLRKLEIAKSLAAMKESMVCMIIYIAKTTTTSFSILYESRGLNLPRRQKPEALRYLLIEVTAGPRLHSPLLDNGQVNFCYSTELVHDQTVRLAETIHQSRYIHFHKTYIASVGYKLMFIFDQYYDSLGKPFLTWLATILKNTTRTTLTTRVTMNSMQANKHLYSYKIRLQLTYSSVENIKRFSSIDFKAQSHGKLRSSFVDKKIEAVQKNRDRLVAEEINAIQKRVNDRIQKRMLNSAQQHKQALQTSWMLLISQFSRCNIISNIVHYDRSERIRWANASRDKKAVRTIELWWPNTYIIYKLYKKNPWTKEIFAKLFMVKWRRLRVEERHTSQALVVQFVKDVTGLGETVRKVYEFRKKVTRVQRWIRGFFWLKHSRLVVLGKALEKEVQKLMLVVQQGIRQKLRKARRVLDSIKGFGEKVRAIDQVSDNINNLLRYQEQLENHRKRGAAKGSAEVWRKRKSNNPVIEINNWRSDMEDIEDGAEKAAFVEMLLHQLRQRHFVSQEALAMQSRNIGIGPRANIDEAKFFLNSESKNSMPKLMEALKHMDNPIVRAKKTAPFYMLTGNGGGLDRAREWAEFYLKQKHGEYFT